MADHVYTNEDGEQVTIETDVEIDARRIFTTYVGDNTQNDDGSFNFHPQLIFTFTQTITTVHTDGTTTVSTSTWVETSDLPNGIFIRPTLNKYFDNYDGELDAETFVDTFTEGACELPPG